MTAQPILVLGMHRSGTSCLTGILEEAGLFLGEVRRKSTHNRKGNRESTEIAALNDAVLAAHGASWDAPPGESHLDWPAECRARRDRILADFPSDRAWGFKDPRTLLVLDGWREAMPQARLVASFRHPLAVAKSLQARHRAEGRFAISEGIALWLAYNRRLLDVLETRGGWLVCFDWPDARYLAAVDGVARACGLTPPAGGFSFFERGLRTQVANGPDALPEEAAALYAALLKRSVGP